MDKTAKFTCYRCHVSNYITKYFLLQCGRMYVDQPVTGIKERNMNQSQSLASSGNRIGENTTG